MIDVNGDDYVDDDDKLCDRRLIECIIWGGRVGRLHHLGDEDWIVYFDDAEGADDHDDDYIHNK